jgi:hypothetical protein
MTGDPYYSDEALRKQAEADALRANGEPVPLTLMLGIIEPRIKATPAERCNCCALDARDDEGGEEHGGLRRCYICVGRGHHEDTE